MKVENIIQYITKNVNRESLKQKIAAILIYCIIGTNTLTGFAETGSFTGSNTSGAAVNASSDSLKARTGAARRTGSNADKENDGEERLLLSGTITTLGTSLNPKTDRDYGVYVDGVLDRSLTVIFIKGIATGSDWEIPIINDLEGVDEITGEVNVWSYFVYSDQAFSTESDFCIRDLTDLTATSSNTLSTSSNTLATSSDVHKATPGDIYKDGEVNYNGNWALFYLDDGGAAISVEGHWSTDAQNLVYIGKEVIEGTFDNRSEMLSLPETISLHIMALDTDDEKYLASASGWITTSAETWVISDALMYNPESLERIIWRGQADYDNGTVVILYENTDDYANDIDYAYSGGTIIFEDISCTITGSIHWDDWNDKFAKRIDLTKDDFTVKNSDGTDITSDVTIVVTKDTENTSVWYYTVAGLTTGMVYDISITVPDGYESANEEITFRAVSGADPEPIVLKICDPVVITIDTKTYGLPDNAAVSYTFTVNVDGVAYDGIYYILDEDANETGSGYGAVTLSANDSIMIQLGITSDEAVTIIQTSASEGITKIGENQEENEYYFTYAAKTSVLASIIWNDNKNTKGFRPDGGNEYSNWSSYLQLFFTLGDDDIRYSIEDDYNLPGFDDWNGFIYLGSYGETPDYYFTADGLPTHIMVDGEVAEVHYSVVAADTDNYLKDEKGYVDAEYNSGSTSLSSWQFVYTALTSFAAKVEWYDDNDNNNTRPAEEDWLEALWVVRIDETEAEVPGQVSHAEPVYGENGVFSIIITFDDGTAVDATATIDKSADGITWSFEINGLIACDEFGGWYTYYVTQDILGISDESTLLNTVPDVAYGTSYGNEGIYLGNTDIVYEDGTIINTLSGQLDFTSEKEWLDGDTSEEKRPKVTLTLWRYPKGSVEGYLGAAKVFVDVDLIYNATTGQYTVTVEDLPAFDEDGHEYVYFMIESMTAVAGGVAVSEYSLTVENVFPFTTGNGISQNSSKTLIYNGSTFTNTLYNTIDVEATKIWRAKAIQGDLDQYTVTLQLQRTTASNWEYVDETIMDTFAAEYTSLSYTFKDQDKYDEEGFEYKYRVIESEVAYGTGESETLADPAKTEAALPGGSGVSYILNGYPFIYSIDEDGNVINELVDELKLVVVKEWSPATSADASGVNELTFILYQNGVRYDNADLNISNGEITLRKDSSGGWTDSINIPNLPLYDEAGREYNYSIGEVSIAGFTSIIKMNMEYDSTELTYILTATVTNTKGTLPGSHAKVYKQWLDDSDTTHRGEVQVQLMKSGNAVVATSSNTTLVKLNGDNYWYDYFFLNYNVDFADYDIEEISIGTNSDILNRTEVEANHLTYDPACDYIKVDDIIYEVSYSYKAPESGEFCGTWTVTNRRIGKVTITLEKEWQEAIDTSRYSVVFHLYRNGVKIKTITLSDAYGWTDSSNYLDKYDENGALYEYTVEEYSIDDGTNVYGAGNSKTSGNAMILKSAADSEDSYSVTIATQYSTDEYNFVADNQLTGYRNITFNKIWKDSNEKDGVTRPDIYLKVYRYTDLDGNGIIDGTAEWDTGTRLDSTPTWVKADDYHWTITYSSLAKYSSNGEEYFYFAEEGMAASSSGGWRQIYLDALPGGSDSDISTADDTGNGYMPADGVVVNYREGTTNISGTKIWENMGTEITEEDYPAITLYLYYQLLDGNGDYSQWQQYYGISDSVSWDSALGKFTYSFGELPKYDPATGYTIQYSISEVMEEDGNPDIGGFTWITNQTSFKLTNTYYEDTDVSITVKKNWEGYPGDLTAIGYPTITLKLYRVLQKIDTTSGDYIDISVPVQIGETVTLKDNDGKDWVHTWSNLSYYAPNGRPYRYEVEESVTIDGGYNTNVESFELATGSNVINITNTYTQETVEITGEKDWSDFSDRWELRPDAVTLTLYRYTTSMKKENAEDLGAIFNWTKNNDDWTYEAQENGKHFYRYATTGEEYTYFIEETAVPGYTTAYTPSQDNQGNWILKVTNTLETVNLMVKKQWEDGDNKYSTRPAEVTVQLQRQWGDEEYRAVNFPGTSSNWEVSVGSANSITFENLPKYHIDANGIESAYEYRAQEINTDGGYEVSYSYGSDTTTITNTLKTVEIAVEKVWDDAENQDGIRTSVSMILYRESDVMGIQTLSDADGWSYNWSGLPKYDSIGKEYAYYVVEEAASPYATTYGISYHNNDGHLITGQYITPISPQQDSKGIFTVTNTYTPKTIELSIAKEWQGDGGNNSFRPASITYTLMQKLEGEDNTAWRPVTLPDGTGNVTQTIPNDGAGDFATITWTNLPVRKNGVTILYKIVETPIAGYTTSYSYGEDGYVNGTLDSESNTNGNSHLITVTNTLTAKTEASIVKVWNDDLAGYNRTDEIASITFKLQRKLLSAADEAYTDVTKAEVGYTDPAATDAGTPVTVTLAVTDQDLEAVFENLPRYNDQGEEYAYRVAEAWFTLTSGFGGSDVYVDSADDLNGSIGGYEYETTYLPAAESGLADYTTGSTTTVSNALKTRSVKAEKIWDDAGYWLDGAYVWRNQDGVRPDTITLELLYDGKHFDPVKTVTLGKNNDGSWSWSYEWTELPYCHADGTQFVYTVAELGEEPAAAGYDAPEYTVSDDGTLTVTNSCDPDTKRITVYKYWSGDEDWEEDRPDSIFVQLYMTIDGLQIAYGDPAKVTAADGWTYTWEDLPVRYNLTADETKPGNSEEIFYGVEEVSEYGYTADIEGNIITNTLSTTQLQVEKVWEDQADYYQTRPDSITIQLQRSVDTTSWTNVGDARELPVTADETLQVIFTGLPVKDKNSSIYYYRAVEAKIGDETVTNGSAYGYQVTYGGEFTAGSTPGEVEIINTLKTTVFSGTKTWVDQSNYYDTRPDEIILTLMSDPEEALAGRQPEANDLSWIKSGDVWSYAYSGLPKYTPDGSIITYWVEEAEIPANYQASYDVSGKNITNTLPVIELNGTKIWEDQSNRYGLRPDNIELTVLANGTTMNIQPPIVWDSSSGDVWTYRITGLPAADNDGREIVYTIEETDVSGYDKTREGYIFTNKLQTGSLAVEKIQNGGNDTAEFTFHVFLIINGRRIPYAGTYTVLDSEAALTAEGERLETSDGTIVMKGSHKFYITDLPAGASFVLTEDASSRFILSGTVNDQGTIPYQAVIEASFTNQYKSSGSGGGGGTTSNPATAETTAAGSAEDQAAEEITSPTSAEDFPGTVPEDTARVVVTDENGNTLYDGPIFAGLLDTSEWGQGTYNLRFFDQDGITLGQATITIDDEGTPFIVLAKTGDSSLPYALLVTILLGAAGGMITLIMKRRKENDEE